MSSTQSTGVVLGCAEGGEEGEGLDALRAEVAEVHDYGLAPRLERGHALRNVGLPDEHVRLEDDGATVAEADGVHVVPVWYGHPRHEGKVPHYTADELPLPDLGDCGQGL